MAGSGVSVSLVTFNAAADVVACLEALAAQTLRPLCVRVFDNASTDGTAEVVAAHFPEVRLYESPLNRGYAAAQNRGAALAHADGAQYVLFLTPDVVLAPDHLERLVGALDADPGAASAGGKLLRPDGRTLDGAGIVASRARHFRDRGQGELDSGQYDDPGASAPFAPCGAAVLHRLEALADVAVGEEVLDESFFAYKEDVDLAWRLRLRGWRLLHVPGATARHRRAAPYASSAPGRRRSLAELRRARRALSPVVRRLSARNQLLVLLKNEHVRVLVSADALRIVGRQLALLGWALVFEPATLVGYVGFLRRLPGALRRRWRFRRKVGHAVSRGWFR